MEYWCEMGLLNETLLSNQIKPQLFHDGDPYNIETSPLICRAKQ